MDKGQPGGARMETFYFQAGEGRHRVEAIAVVNGADLVVTVGGGSVYHIGAVALAVPRPSLAEPGRTSASASVICVSGHKEDELARTAALQLAARFNRVVVVSVGLHVDDASSLDIESLTANFRLLVEDIAARLSATGVT
ncbi:MAG: hypothetical protein ABRQ24_10970 [Syntrophomonadaceae bacterium]